jgi:hypothetical protein
MKSKKFLFGIVVVLLMVTLVLPGCNEELPPVEADKLVIPSSTTPVEVFNETANAGPYVCPLPFYQNVWSAEYMRPDFMPEGALEEQFIEGYCAVLTELFYIKRDGERVGCGFYKIVSVIVILKYEDIGPAEKSFISVSETQQLQNSTYGGITLKNGTHSLDEWKEAEVKIGEWDESVVPCYVIHSDCFVIYFYGRDDVTKDILDRIIVAFGVKE